MGTTQERVQGEETAPDAPPAAVAAQGRTRQSLPAKGSCWYCEKPLDSVRRFCGKECADAFDEEAEFDADAIANPPR